MKEDYTNEFGNQNQLYTNAFWNSDKSLGFNTAYIAPTNAENNASKKMQ